MENYQHALFFEAKNLSDASLKQIKLHFQIRRKSGGGECEVQKVGDSIYKICFRKKEGQEEICVSLSRDNVAESNKQPKASDQQTHASAKNVEKVFKLEHYLLRYLIECTKVSSDLEQRLSLLSSTFQIHTDSEEIVVVRDQTAQDNCPLKKWEFSVEQVLEELQNRYTIYFEVETDRLAILQENSFLFNETLKIYHEEEACLAVVVGERDQVEKILKFVDALQAKQQVQTECAISEKQFALVREPFEEIRKSNFPAIMIKQERPGILTLEGPEKEVHAGKKDLLNLARGVKEKRILLHHKQINFLASSDGVQHFQNRFQQSLRSPVMLETAGSDLLLLSLSDGALQEAAAAMQTELCFETVSLEQTDKQSSGFTTLKEALSEAVQQANRGGVKVELSYQRSSISDPRIDAQLVGYTTEVRRLKNILLEYKQNHENTHHCLPLPMTEMVKHFSEILSLVGVKKSTVEINPTCTPSPCVHLTGPRCEVECLKENLESGLQKLFTKRFVVNGPGVQPFFQGEGMETLKLAQASFMVRILPIDEEQEGGKVTKDTSFTSLQNLPNTASIPQPTQTNYSDKAIHIKLVIGGLEEQQADVFVAPMVQMNLTSTMVGSCLLQKAGQQLQSNFNSAKGQRTLRPGDVLEVDGTPTLGCSKIFFMECVPKGGKKYNSGQALQSGLCQVLALCEQHSWGSVALPIIGPGLVLSIPVKDAIKILTDEIEKFLYGSTGSLHTICIPIMPRYTHSEEMFQTVCNTLNAKMVDNTGQALFHSLTTDLDEVIMAVDGIQLHLVFGDITNETTDAIVNTTDFKDFQTGVCKDILTKAGSQVQANLTGVQVQRGQIFTTQPGGFPCKLIIHVCGERDPSVIKTLAKDIVVHCEGRSYKSVAIPAICAGKGGLDPSVVAKSILEGVKDAVQGAYFHYLKTVRIILLKINVFLEFKAMAQQIFSVNTQLTAPAPHVAFHATTRGHSALTTGASVSIRERQSQSLPSSLNFSSIVTSLPVTQSTAAFLVIGFTNDDVSHACRELKRAYDNQCSTHSFSSEDFGCLTDDEVDQLCSKLNSLHLQMQQSNADNWVVSGLKDGVNEVVRLIQSALRRQVRERDQENLFTKVTWCILGKHGVWQKVAKEMNLKLERQDVKEGIVDAQGVKWTVNLRNMVATACGTGQVTKLKRLENPPDFSLPIYWDNMSQSEVTKVINLDQSSKEYERVKMDFKKTVKKTVLKIKRIQNVHLRRLYEARKKELEIRNGPMVRSGEKILYHGTTEAACKSIINSNFNRNFAGQNATLFGVGTYFAVNASYSANPVYAVPATDGAQLMFVARVLTGYYDQGQKDMRTPPIRLLPNHPFDSVVDNMQNPTMFVVFHDCQAYPDYLITFK
ncbi:protein mono-ADP-ribosyltransferase PARP14-like isoform X2 [Myxocyprinus asiaticus]|uniref:protein mono-ADP-ribosyltransferase PARP14-like isoform X2 n=1 Tax=Myxocyprinus asiaticus TaxID=70543 RepID=UPI0022232936|nr:protein mono-ADP-ribosyltransferase PARP14-like isoform X2 [Myxocyprinus asiaticus]